MQQIDQFQATFFQECEELLSSLEQHLSGLVTSADQPESINAAFRAVHSIKGGAGMFGFNRMTAFAHLFENALDQLRKGKLSANRDVIDKLLSASDILADLAAAARSGASLPEDYEAIGVEELAPLGDAAKQLDRARETPASAPGGIAATYRIQFTPADDILRRGMDPLLIVRELEGLGNVKVCADTSRLPSFEDLDPATNYLAWEFEITTSAPQQAIAEVFEFISLRCQLSITPINEDGSGDVTAALDSEQQRRPEIAAPFKNERRVSSIRVDLDRVERLVDLVGEVTIAQAMVLQQIDQSSVDANPFLYRALSQLSQLSRNLQEGVMAIRAQPIRSVFARMPRVVREVAMDSGKRVDLVMTGEETEIDKTIVEQLSDPLMHIVRNAVDHGIETPDVRRQAGKPEVGRLQLSAHQRGGRIIVEITDDGQGINRESVRNKAISLGLADPDMPMSPREIDNLIFAPGLSTAHKLSEFSGRGVGMDVVSRNILGIGGRIAIRSAPGVGTTTTITLPLTLAVLDAMLIRAGSQSYFVPLNNVVQSLVIDKREIRHVPGSGNFVSVRGRQVKVFNLAEQLGRPLEDLRPRVQVMILEVESGAHVGLIVEEISGHRQVVVKSIDQNFATLPGISGATILGDGNVALILDVAQLTQLQPGRSVPLQPSEMDSSEAMAL